VSRPRQDLVPLARAMVAMDQLAEKGGDEILVERADERPERLPHQPHAVEHVRQHGGIELRGDLGPRRLGGLRGPFWFRKRRPPGLSPPLFWLPLPSRCRQH